MKYLSIPLTLSVALTLAACGGGEEQIPETTDTTETAAGAAAVNTLETGVTLPGYPHKVDIYRPAGATKALVFLHGHGGRNFLSAYDLGFNKKQFAASAKNVDWTWLQSRGVIAVFPQGQVAPGTAMPTWNNWIFDSGQDDVGFLRALASTLKSKYGATSVALSGHSSGGVMTARMWCESTSTFQSYVSVAGPMASPYPAPGLTCSPTGKAPFMMVVGDADTKLPSFTLGRTPLPEYIDAGLTQAYLAGEFVRHHDRALAQCGEIASLSERKSTATTLDWSDCAGKVRYTVVPGADHPVASIEQAMGVRMADTVWGFAAAPSATSTAR